MPDAFISWALEHGGPLGIAVVALAILIQGGRFLSPFLDRALHRRNDADPASNQQLADRRQLSEDTKEFQDRLLTRLDQAEARVVQAEVRMVMAEARTESCERERESDQLVIKALEARILVLEKLLRIHPSDG